MGHSHNHSNYHLNSRNLFIAVVLNIAITAAQIIGGLISGSLALLSDALHNFSDVVSLIISWVANRLVQRKASLKRTFGFKRAEILAAFVNAAALVIIALFLIYEAIERFRFPQDINSNLVIWLSLIAIIGNGISVLLLKGNADDNMNLKTAYLHLFTDMMASVAVLVGGLLMKYFQLWWIDSLLTFAIAIYLIIMGWRLLRDSFKVLMLFTPNTTSVSDIVKDIEAFEEIKNVHHVHIWQLNEDEIHLEAHVDFNADITLSEFDVILVKIEDLLFKKHDINHVNIQPEFRKLDAKDVIVQD